MGKTHRGEAKRVDFDTESGHVLLLEFTSQVALDESGLFEVGCVSDGDGDARHHANPDRNTPAANRRLRCRVGGAFRRDAIGPWSSESRRRSDSEIYRGTGVQLLKYYTVESGSMRNVREHIF